MSRTARTETVRWTWQGHEVELGIDRTGSGPAVLLLPALSSISTRHEMGPLATRLADEHQTITADWPGCGDRPRPQLDWTPQHNSLDALAELIDGFIHHSATPSPVLATRSFLNSIRRDLSNGPITTRKVP